MRIFVRTSLLVLVLAVGARVVAAQADRDRPIILLVHGRGMLGRDTAATRQLWLDALRSGAATMTRGATLEDRDVRVVWYADVLDPRVASGCDYSAGDPRALRDSRTDGSVKQFVSLAGGLLTALSGMAEGEQATEVRGLAADASFLADARKRCATEARLDSAISRARGEGRPIILVGHSLGSLVAYDYLSSRKESGLVQEFVSIGSMVGASGLRQLLIGGDSTDTLSIPKSVRSWVNVRNDKDPLATPLPLVRDIVTTPPADELDPHEMVGYLRGTAAAKEILGAWCGAFSDKRPLGCKEIAPR
jgi:pimeloyl-ACP methyl ester carboxylesterase